MTTIPAPTFIVSQEEWPDADFDLPEGQPIHTVIDKDDGEEDWDLEMDLGSTGGAKAKAVVAGIVARFENNSRSLSNSQSQIFTIRPPPPMSDVIDDDDDDEGVSTIKVAALPIRVPPKPQTTIDEDFEDAFALPSDLTQLSLAPLSLNHRSSKNSLEWGDKDHTSSSQSSDAYSTLGFADASPSSNSASSLSLPETEAEEDEEDDGELEGLVIPTALFESGQGARQLTKILEKKKKAPFTRDQIKTASPDPEDDFEMGLVIDDDVDLSPSRLLSNTQQSSRVSSRSNSMPPQRPSSLRPPSRLRLERAKSPANPPPSSVRQLQKLRLSPSPPLRPPTRSQTFQTLSSIPSPSSASFLSPKPGSLRGQKSHSGLKPPTPPSTITRKLTRKASLSSLLEASQSQALGSGSASSAGGSKFSRYDEPTAASRAKSHKSSVSRTGASDFKVPPTRPSTPSSNPNALRLTMPTQSRIKTRPPLTNVFAGPSTASSSTIRATSPLPPRPPSSASTKAARVSNPPPPVPKVLRRPKRQRTYGDGTELDAIEDLPTDREKEGQYRVQPKGYGNRIPGGSYPSKSSEKGILRRNGRREFSGGNSAITAFAPSTNTLKRTGRIEFPTKTPNYSEILPKKRKNVSSPTAQTAATRRKPTLIRNLGGTGGPKVVGDMKWNPHSLRWEGNDHVLRDFDAAVGTSTRPALITHLTGSSIGSPAGSFTSGARIVGNMIFDPARMCWISTLPPDEDEPDVFANLADDEDDADNWETKGGTIRASLQGLPASDRSGTTETNISRTNSSASSDTREEAPSPACSHTRTISESGSDRGSRASMVCDVDDAFLERCRLAEERHRLEMKGWKSALSKQDTFSKPDRSHLFEIRALATRKY
ncbi:hypothetical protein BD779DRAFT_44483 [Infundibulicybe gibba]|nr:hypothetical protein BD779DRAFT_44483 [Infundibulicybe gibba]